MVEMGGIEPPSSKGDLGLLRAQLFFTFYLALMLSKARHEQAQSYECPLVPLRRRYESQPSKRGQLLEGRHSQADPSVADQAARAKFVRTSLALIGFKDRLRDNPESSARFS